MNILKSAVSIVTIILLLMIGTTLECKTVLSRYERLFVIETVYGSVADRENFSGLISKLENILYNSYFVKLPVKVQDYRYARTLFRRKHYKKIYPLQTHTIEISKDHLKVKKRLINQYRKNSEFQINTFTSFKNDELLSEISRHVGKMKLFKVRLYFNLTESIINIQIYKLKRFRRSSIRDMFRKEKNWLPFYESGNIEITGRKFVEIAEHGAVNLDVKLEQAWESKTNIVSTWNILSTLFFEGGFEDEKESELEFERENNSLVMELKKKIILASFR